MNVTKILNSLHSLINFSFTRNGNRSLICVCTPSSQHLGYHLVKLKIGWLVAQQEKDSHDKDPILCMTTTLRCNPFHSPLLVGYHLGIHFPLLILAIVQW